MSSCTRVLSTDDIALSGDAKWPAQRNSFLSMYEWLLSQGVPASKIVFSGTSAGGT